jgi:hypothetical protein
MSIIPARDLKFRENRSGTRNPTGLNVAFDSPTGTCECRRGQGERDTEGRHVRVQGTTMALVVRQLTFVEAGRVEWQDGPDVHARRNLSRVARRLPPPPA